VAHDRDSGVCASYLAFGLAISLAFSSSSVMAVQDQRGYMENQLAVVDPSATTNTHHTVE